MAQKRKLRASTLTELLVVMILSGIVLLSVFDGLSLFEKLFRRFSGELDASMARMEGFYRLESLFDGADSIRREAETFLFYREGEPWKELSVSDSLLVVSQDDLGEDTLLRRISAWRTIPDAESAGWIDSLILIHDTTTLRFGMNRSPHRNATMEIETLEKQYLDEN
jgi:hypothetical protein